MMNKIIFFDSTLRDGSHAVRHQISLESIRNYCRKIDGAGLYTVIVGHGNGLGASSLQVGLSAHSDVEMLTAARQELHKTKLGVFLLPGFGTIKDDLAPAIDLGVDVVCVACHCTEADTTRQHIEYVISRGKEAFGVLMMYHRASPEKLLEEARKMQDYGAKGVILMDSAGASIPSMVSNVIRYLTDNLEIPVGFHGHNNLGMAVAHSLLAVESGATIIDGTLCGFGAGAGNCQLEALAALMHKNGMQTNVDLYKLLDASEEVATHIMTQPQEISSLSIVSGLAGIFSGFTTHVKNAAKRFNVDPRDIFIELGKLKVVGGQEDAIVRVAMNLADKRKDNERNYQIESLS
ncbi:MAG: 4-hydroxy-2-oxovalerate aldolase [Candidatus Magasanikbacteria bacterium CG10_big_fil_rev_8_21_14_0_10_36_32]|uniref:4-hydroxy-2-oxovalerate aldolase n=1 Tax=Candidatus Magasanikbacteria bacterium CG10_big_fil_rev_8_21_14_0_10_36_32 TaxID=1974646 RepID=A0A2M6W5V7_9BACT|nr:MAG: 4-hydroxy-2-oxovalerate aldolase [Candidatus Magasanikbacteria bacterium CG10_big_fil_rev_8_21_14_0_10_36_32]